MAEEVRLCRIIPLSRISFAVVFMSDLPVGVGLIAVFTPSTDSRWNLVVEQTR